MSIHRIFAYVQCRMKESQADSSREHEATRTLIVDDSAVFRFVPKNRLYKELPEAIRSLFPDGAGNEIKGGKPVVTGEPSKRKVHWPCRSASSSRLSRKRSPWNPRANRLWRGLSKSVKRCWANSIVVRADGFTWTRRRPFSTTGAGTYRLRCR